MSATAWMVLALVAVVVIWAIAVYNRLVQLRNRIANAFGQIDVQLKRRHDLIPNLVETVKGYAAHEKETLERVIKARNSAISAAGGSDVKQLSQAENILSGALRQIFALSENYPDLKANQNFLQLQEEIGSTENRIGFARQHYNDCAALYNTALRQFPGNVVSMLGRFQPAQFYELDQAEAQAVRETPKVSF